jgi:large subunit ribosomal protein L23
MKVNELLIKPVLTEKATQLANRQVYTFEVNLKANKKNIAAVLEKLYPVKVAAVRLVVRPGKVRRTGRKMISRKTSQRKIAYITVKEGKIDLFPQT